MNDPIGQAGDVGYKGSQASSSTNFYPKTLRLFWYQAGCLVYILLGAIVFGMLAIVGGWKFDGGVSVALWVLGFVLLLPSLALIGFIFRAMPIMREGYKNGLLTAGLVESVSPVNVLHIAVLSNGGGDFIYGILRERHDPFPSSDAIKGKRIPCVSVFSDEVYHEDSWHSFRPTPVSFGTTDQQKLDHCLKAVETDTAGDGDYFAILSKFLAKNTIPADSKEVYVCDTEGNLIETRER